MKNAFIIFLSILIIGCSNHMMKKVSVECNQPDFNNWKEHCLQKFDSKFKNENEIKDGTILRYIRREIANIQTKEQKKFFCQLKDSQRKKWDKFTLIYHYFEGEVNMAIQTFVFQNKENCIGIIWNPILKKSHKSIDCSVYEKERDLQSNFFNNGLLIISHFDNEYVLNNTEIYYGIAYDQIDYLISSYPMRW